MANLPLKFQLPGFEPEKQSCTIRTPSKVGAPSASDRRRGRPDLVAGQPPRPRGQDIIPAPEKDAATTAMARGRGETGHGTSQRKLQAEQPSTEQSPATRGRCLRVGACARGRVGGEG